MTTPRILVKFQQQGFHRFPDAPEFCRYLAERHRHLFHVEVFMPVYHDEREVEFHAMLNEARHRFRCNNGIVDYGTASCETLAGDLAQQLATHYSREVTVRVLEDGECGAEVTRGV